MISGFSLYNHLEEQKDRRVQCNKTPPIQPRLLHLFISQLKLGEEEEGQGRCDNDKEMGQGSGADKRKLHCLALPDQRNQADMQGTSALVKTWLHQLTRTTPPALPRPTTSP